MPNPILDAISAALSATNALQTIASTVVDAKVASDVAEWRLRTAEVVSALADAKLEVVEMLAQIAELEKQLDQRGNSTTKAGCTGRRKTMASTVRIARAVGTLPSGSFTFIRFSWGGSLVPNANRRSIEQRPPRYLKKVGNGSVTARAVATYSAASAQSPAVAVRCAGLHPPRDLSRDVQTPKQNEQRALAAVRAVLLDGLQENLERRTLRQVDAIRGKPRQTQHPPATANRMRPTSSYCPRNAPRGRRPPLARLWVRATAVGHRPMHAEPRWPIIRPMSPTPRHAIRWLIEAAVIRRSPRLLCIAARLTKIEPWRSPRSSMQRELQHVPSGHDYRCRGGGLRRHRHERALCHERGIRLGTRVVQRGQRLRNPVHLLLDPDRHRFAQVRRAGPAGRQQRRGWARCDAGTGVGGGERQAEASSSCYCWWASSERRCSTATV